MAINKNPIQPESLKDVYKLLADFNEARWLLWNYGVITEATRDKLAKDTMKWFNTHPHTLPLRTPQPLESLTQPDDL